MSEVWTLACIFGFWGWIATVAGFILCSFPSRGALAKRAATRWGSAFVLLYALWIIGMLKA